MTLDTHYQIFLRRKSFFIPKSFTFHLREYCGQTVSCLNQQEVGSLLLACNGFNNVLRTVGNLFDLMQAQCVGVNRAFMEYLVQQ
jgi:hypothetical protein